MFSVCLVFCKSTINSVFASNSSKRFVDSIDLKFFSVNRLNAVMDMKTLEQQLYNHCKPIRDWILVKILDRECLIEESDVCLVMAVGDKTYKNKSGYLVELNVSKGDRVLIPRKVRRITADITTDFFMVSMFDILSFWK